MMHIFMRLIRETSGLQKLKKGPVKAKFCLDFNIIKAGVFFLCNHINCKPISMFYSLEES